MRTLTPQLTPSPTLVAAFQAAQLAKRTTATQRKPQRKASPKEVVPPTIPTMPEHNPNDPESYHRRMIAYAAIRSGGFKGKPTPLGGANSIGCQYRAMVSGGMNPNEALTEVYRRAAVSAHKRSTGRAYGIGTNTERNVREYESSIDDNRMPRSDWNADVAADTVIGILCGEYGIATSDDTKYVPTEKVAIGTVLRRNDRANNKATRYWTCRYFVRYLFVIGEGGVHIPYTGDGWMPISHKLYRLAKKLPPNLVETTEYRFAPNTLTENDHEGGRNGTGYDAASPEVVEALATLSDTERRAVELYATGATMTTIQRGIFGMGEYGKILGCEPTTRKILRSALNKVARYVREANTY